MCVKYSAKMSSSDLFFLVKNTQQLKKRSSCPHSNSSEHLSQPVAKLFVKSVSPCLCIYLEGWFGEGHGEAFLFNLNLCGVCLSESVLCDPLCNKLRIDHLPFSL